MVQNVEIAEGKHDSEIVGTNVICYNQITLVQILGISWPFIETLPLGSTSGHTLSLVRCKGWEEKEQDDKSYEAQPKKAY